MVAGTSTTGTPHGLLFETGADDTAKVTIVGHDGKKRHASIVLANIADVDAAIAAFQLVRERLS